MKFVPVLVAGICCFLLACSPSKNSKSSNNESISYNHLFIIGNTADISARVQLEKDFAEVTTAKGYTIVKSLDIFHTSLSDPKPPTTEQITDSLKAIGCDALFVVSLKRKQELNHSPGVQINKNTPILGAILAGVAGQKGPDNMESFNKLGTYTYQNGFYITCNLIDAKTQSNIYSSTSEMIEYSQLNKLSKVYIKSLVELLEAKKILRK